jgi:diguanylate cyclase (GGDEF)-like protein
MEPREVVALIGFQALMLVLLAFLGMAAGREQRRARDAALRLARFDPLTGLYNRAHLFASMEREVRLSARAGRTFALLMIDLDGLKPVNDTFGHHYGDQILRGVAEVIQHTVRTSDTPARYGGDEFVVLLPETDAAGAYVVAEKLRRDVAALAIRVSDRVARTSVSVGLVAYPEDGTTVVELMAAADAALYEAKRSGRDRIVGYTTRTERVATRMGAGRGSAGSAGSGTPPGSAAAVERGTAPGSAAAVEHATAMERGTAPGSGTAMERGTAPGSAAAAERGTAAGSGTAPGSGTPPESGTAMERGTAPGSGTTPDGGTSPASAAARPGEAPLRPASRVAIPIPVETRTVRGRAPWETATATPEPESVDAAASSPRR